MANTASPSRTRPVYHALLGPLASRPRLTSGIVVGLVIFVASSLLPSELERSTRAILAWDVTCLWFVLLTLQHMRGRDQGDIKARVAAQDEGQGMILALVLIAAATSLAAVAVELSLAKDAHSLMKGFRVGLALATVMISWFTTQLVFALHYAHEYYAPDWTTPDETDVIGGLQFPNDPAPDYWDFLHFAVVIGAASQTADVAFTNKRLRRIGTVHGLVAFTFNTAVLALTINLLSGLF
ncbi:DUF1345 domain-containing protein [Lichenihabitans sp. Uapishka_5]|uniref:DUF1345 domain-containing protein n=1 Tax=Lichenihabitans sp. Uapishka_5 TaxID=3037302 RepID=UPI0029E7E3AD|nr:DUF1345 domain-containing protein [Lichenihabitans sp. Uapishka_5]MDX7951538.1 DUF1345 domain-containing protein [Lichenihabitans sp. Uapishka_5]